MLLKSPAADKAAGQTENAGTFIGVSLWNAWRWKLDEGVATFTPVHEADSVLRQLIQRYLVHCSERFIPQQSKVTGREITATNMMALSVLGSQAWFMSNSL